MFIVLILIILANLYNSYRAFKTIMAPSVLFCLGFLLCSLNAYNYKDLWDLNDLNSNTFYVLGFGITAFSLFSIYIFKKNKKKTKEIAINLYHIPSYILFIYAIVQIAFYVLYFREIQHITGTSNFALAIATIDYENKFGNDPFSFPLYIKFGKKIFSTIAYLLPHFGAQAFILQKTSKLHRLLYIIIILTSIVSPILTGGRAGCIGVALSVFFHFYFVYKYKTNWRASIPKKAILIICTIGVCIILLWSTFGEAIGRASSEDRNYNSNYYTAIYCGAQIKNLDLYLNEQPLKHSKYWGQITFINLRHYNDNDDIKQYFPFREYNSYPLGNVCTCFYAYICDFGYWGTTLILLFSYIVTKVWIKLKQSSKSTQLLYLSLYATFCYSILFSFFSNDFFQILASRDFIYRVILWLLEIFIINRLWKVRNQ